MTVSNETNRTSVVGSGATGQRVPFGFPITLTSDLLVKKRITSTGVETTETETTNYTVEINGTNGGVVTTVTTIETTETIHIIRNTPFTQTLDLETGGSYNAQDIETAMDRNTKLAIESKDLLDNKVLRFPQTDGSLTTELPSAIDRASKVLSFDSSGNATASSAVPTGSVSFTTFGTNMAEAANAEAGKVVMNIDNVFDATDTTYGAVGDGVTDDSAALQAVLDAAQAVNGIVILPRGTYSFDTTLEIYNSVRVIGLGQNMSRANLNEAGVILRWDGDTSTDAIIIGGTSQSSQVVGGFNYVEGVTLENFLLVPGSELDAGAGLHDEGGQHGIVIDGSNTLDGDRGVARDIVLKDVDIRRFLGNGLYTLGTAFKVRTFRCTCFKNKGTGYKNEAAATNVGTGTAGQMYLYDTILFSHSAGDKAGEMIQTTMYGGHIQGPEGVTVQTCNIYGTHIEGDSTQPQNDGTIGIHIIGRGGNYFPELAVTKYNYGIKIGDGTASSHDAYYGNIGLLSDCQVGVWITDGGSRSGFMNISLFGAGSAANGTDIQDDRLDTDVVNRYAKDFLKVGSSGILTDNTVIAQKTVSFGASDTTPTVSKGNLFASGGPVAITDFDDGLTGQIITVVAEHSVQIADNNNIVLNGSRNFDMVLGDTLTLVLKSNGVWWETARSENDTGIIPSIVCVNNAVVCVNNEVVQI